MKSNRYSGILLHVTSLPGSYGIGDLGHSAYEFADFLAETGTRLWQLLPLTPTGYGDSPYQGFSAFAGNPLLIDLDALQEEGLLNASDLTQANSLPNDYVDYGAVIAFKNKILRRAALKFFEESSADKKLLFQAFCEENQFWLDDYALFMACKEFFQGVVWTDWDDDIRRRDPEALAKWSTKLAQPIQVFKYWQFKFFQQWRKLKKYCHDREIRMMGDIPIYVSHDSADVWARPELFYLDERGNPTVVAGVPPDYFSSTGQRWGNPIYRWNVSADENYDWWKQRFRLSLDQYDIVRLDHFRGFESYWEIPADAPTAVNGKWMPGPGADLFRALEAEFGKLPVVAENLGVVTPEVEALREEFSLPGMSLLQFAFGNDPQAQSFQPHNYVRNLFAYTGGHDNDTTVGWWTESGLENSTRTAEDVRKERDFARLYLGFKDDEIQWAFIRAVLASVADAAVIPLQDLLGLGSDARMNLPGTTKGNWKWRYIAGAITPEIRHRLKMLNQTYQR